MKHVLGKIRGLIMSFSFQERRKRKLEKYKNEVRALGYIRMDEMNMDYIELKVKYAHKKRVLSAIVFTITLSIIMNIWGVLGEFMLRVIVYLNAGQVNEEKLAVIVFLIGIIVFIVTIFVFFIFLFLYLKDMKELNKKIMMIEQIKVNK